MDRDDDERIRSTCLILCKSKGDILDTKRTMASLFTEVLGKGFSGAPWFCVFFFRGEDTKVCWQLNTTKAEWDQLKKAIGKPKFWCDKWAGSVLSRRREPGMGPWLANVCRREQGLGISWAGMHAVRRA